MCNDYFALVQDVLDHIQSEADLDHEHSLVCKECESLKIATRKLISFETTSPLLMPKHDLADSIVPSAIYWRQRDRLKRRGVFAFASSLAASVLIAIVAYQAEENDSSRYTTRELNMKHGTLNSKLASPPPIDDSLREFGSTFVSLTRKTASQTLEPARNLIVGDDSNFIEMDLQKRKELTLPEIASPIDPIADTARRAINLIIRDVSTLAPTLINS